MTIEEPLLRRRGSAALMTAVACMLFFGLLAVVNVARLELGPLAGQVISADELYFSACAARGLDTGRILMAGCHDNKAPFIFLAHRLAMIASGPYDLTAIKIGALGTMIVILALAGWLAHRVAGILAAVSAVALVSLAMAVDAEHLAFKTETLGAVFLLASMLCCRDPSGKLWRWFLGGAFLGLASLTKQTYGFAMLGLLGWCWISSRADDQRLNLKLLATRATTLALGVALPFTVAVALFLWKGELTDFLSSLLLYPSVYGKTPLSSLSGLRWRLGFVFSDLALVPVVSGLFACAVLDASIGPGATHVRGGRSADSGTMVVLVAASMLLVVFMSPLYFRYHLVPAWILMATAGGIVIGRWSVSAQRCEPALLARTAAVLVVLSISMAALSWSSNGGKGRSPLSSAVEDSRIISASPGQYAYVLGKWPEFYVYNHLIPASDVQFVWALPGTPASGGYSPPPTDSTKGRLLASVHERNLRRLYEDFRRTPPSYIVVADEMARSRTSTRIADVPGFDEYLKERCVFAGSAPRRADAARNLFRCNDARDR